MDDFGYLILRNPHIEIEFVGLHSGVDHVDVDGADGPTAGTSDSEESEIGEAQVVLHWSHASDFHRIRLMVLSNHLRLDVDDLPGAGTVEVRLWRGCLWPTRPYPLHPGVGTGGWIMMVNKDG